MNGKHRRTLGAVFTEPTSTTVERKAIEASLVAAGCEIVEGSGSRVRFSKGGKVESFHRPHPAKEATRYQGKLGRSGTRT